jgi:competence protein ComEC
MKNINKIFCLIFCCLVSFLIFILCKLDIVSINYFTRSISSVHSTSVNRNLKIHYIDVGQGDCELVQLNNENLLIDSGSSQYNNALISYLKKFGIEKIDYVIATHPHEDHIGNMAAIINSFEINNFYAPKITSSMKSFEEMIEALKNNNLKIIPAKTGKNFSLGKTAKCEIIAPNSTTYDNINDYSVILKLTYGDTKFLFTGDAEEVSEKEVIYNNFDINCDVLKVGHHGSSSSSSTEFLKKITPKVAIISCGKNNNFGHPHKETLNNFKKFNCKIYRTDIEGTIILMSDGKTISKLKK